MRPRSLTLAALFGAALLGCASIVGIGDLSPDGGSGSGSGTAGGSSSGSASGSSGGGCAIPAGATCAVDPQCGCMAGEKCDITSVASCIPAGSEGTGSLCTANAQCGEGLTCASGVCHPFCPTSQVGEACAADPSGVALDGCIQIFSGTVAVPQDSFCFIACNPVPNGCPGGQSCNLVEDGAGRTYTDCEAAGATAAGQACAAGSECVAGSSCIAFSNGNFCAQWCRVGVTGDCPGTETCVTGTTPPVVNGTTYGVCQ